MSSEEDSKKEAVSIDTLARNAHFIRRDWNATDFTYFAGANFVFIENGLIRGYPRTRKVVSCNDLRDHSTAALYNVRSSRIFKGQRDIDLSKRKAILKGRAVADYLRKYKEELR